MLYNLSVCIWLNARRGDINWLPRSCNLTPLDSFLWDYAKDRVYVDKPSNLDFLKTNICRVMAEIENYFKRINACNVQTLQ